MVAPSTAESMTIEELENEVKAKPGDATLKKRLGWAYYHAGEPFEAKRILETARSANPGNVEILYALGIVLKKIGEKSDARQVFSEVVQLTENADVSPRHSMIRHLAENQITIMDRL
ncbi:MAG: tetratricopeptide repeat protein [Anaerolineales bacterium]|nr:tetratricopeptide repeat protein [Anaerolineales bacterium]